MDLRRRLLSGVVLLAAAGALAPRLAADIVHLRGGRTIEGLVIEYPDSVEIEGRNGSVTVPRAQIESIEKKQIPWLEYENRHAELKKDDAEGHYQLAVYCKEHGLKLEADAEFRAAVAANPDHEGARLALGFKKVGAHWLTEDEVRRELGYVQYGGEWLKPEEAKLREQVEQEKRLKEQLKKQIAELIDQTGFTDEAVREHARDALDKLEPEVRIPALRAATTHDNPAVRMYAILELGRLKVRAAAGDLAGRVLADPVPELRKMAVAALENVEHPHPAAFFLAYLNDGRPDVRVRAYAALSLFPDKDAAAPLIQALEKSLDRPAPPPHNLSAGVVTSSDTSGGRFSEPNKTAEANSVILDQGESIDRIGLAETERLWIRKALKASTGFDFGMNLQMWHFWLRKELERRVNPGDGDKK